MLKNKKNKETVVIGDEGIEKKRDIFGSVVIIFCVVMIASLTVLGVLSVAYSHDDTISEEVDYGTED